MTDRARLPCDFMPAVPSSELRSDDVADGQMMSQNQVFDGFGMTGRNISLSLSWSGFPAQAKNFPVTLFDPDAPTGSGLSEGVFHVRNDYMVEDSGGAAPPEGDPPHRYVFAVHALDVESLGVSDEISPAMAGFNLRLHTIAGALLIPVYGY